MYMGKITNEFIYCQTIIYGTCTVLTTMLLYLTFYGWCCTSFILPRILHSSFPFQSLYAQNSSIATWIFAAILSQTL